MDLIDDESVRRLIEETGKSVRESESRDHWRWLRRRRNKHLELLAMLGIMIGDRLADHTPEEQDGFRSDIWYSSMWLVLSDLGFLRCLGVKKGKGDTRLTEAMLFKAAMEFLQTEHAKWVESGGSRRPRKSK